jgi:hypothetical protein
MEGYQPRVTPHVPHQQVGGFGKVPLEQLQSGGWGSLRYGEDHLSLPPLGCASNSRYPKPGRHSESQVQALEGRGQAFLMTSDWGEG